jgi:RimJ/RimL family protein N-acetyltransferase
VAAGAERRGVSIRRARPDDVDFLVELYADPDVRPFLAGGHDFGRESVAADVERSERDPDAFGVFLIEVDGERAGAMSFERSNARSRIARLGALAVHPRFRGRRLADRAARELVSHLLHEAGFHRLELEIYGFNERAMAHAERAGFVREGVKRRAYRHGDGWVDGMLYAIVREDLGAE